MPAKCGSGMSPAIAALPTPCARGAHDGRSGVGAIAAADPRAGGADRRAPVRRRDVDWKRREHEDSPRGEWQV